MRNNFVQVGKLRVEFGQKISISYNSSKDTQKSFKMTINNNCNPRAPFLDDGLKAEIPGNR